MKWMKVTVSLQCSVLQGNLGLWHSCRCAKYHSDMSAATDVFLQIEHTPIWQWASSKTVAAVSWTVTAHQHIVKSYSWTVWGALQRTALAFELPHSWHPWQKQILTYSITEAIPMLWLIVVYNLNIEPHLLIFEFQLSTQPRSLPLQT